MEQPQRGRGGRGRGRGRGGRDRGGNGSENRTTNPAEAETRSLSDNLQRQLTIRPPTPPSPVGVPPSSSKSSKPPRRPGYGTIGRRVILSTNHFPVQINVQQIFHYDVSITPEVPSKALNMSIMQELIRVNGPQHLNRLCPVYDRRKGLYTAKALPFKSKEFSVELTEEGRTTFQVGIKLVGQADATIFDELRRLMNEDNTKVAIHALDIVLRQTPYLTPRYVPVSASFYSPLIRGRGPAGNGIECWMGYYSSLRPTQMGLSLNIDISATSFIEPLLVNEFVQQYLNIRDARQPLSASDCTKIKKVLRGVKVQVTHRGDAVRKYRISGISTDPANRLMFSLDDGGETRTISVAQYFRSQYDMQLRCPTWPCIMVGSDKRPLYLPMEVCRILEGQRYTKKLNEMQVQALLKATARRPHERENSTREVVERNNYAEDEYLQAFGMDVTRVPCSVEGRVLPAPLLKYGDRGRETQCQPYQGQWNMMNKMFFNGGNLNNWAFLNLSSLDMGSVWNFLRRLGSMCQQMGMFFNQEPLVGVSSNPNFMLRDLARIYDQSKAANKQLELLIVVLPDRSSATYSELKKVCETRHGIVSQCCLAKNVQKCAPAYLQNLTLKVNVKVNGRNNALVEAVGRTLPSIKGVPTIIFGADVSHPGPGDNSTPSIAAVVASTDWPQMTNYGCVVSAQPRGQEIIRALYIDPKTSIIRDHLLTFYKKNNRLEPQRIIFFRDGVSEGQFNEVLLYEILAIRKACQSIKKDYLPRVTFIVVQKRHHTRFFPRDESDRSGNVLPGTVVDTKVCHPTQFDFYLCSHAGIQGTSRPVHYHVLLDENNFSADELQMLTNKLCYTYNRCTRAVSIVPPAYYAHLAAARARLYIADRQEQESMSTNAPSLTQSLPPLADNLKDIMFYC